MREAVRTESASPVSGPRVIGTRHEIADRNIARYQKALKNGTGNPAVCRGMIDKWLEYRLGPNDERRL